jgi:hypothetical protein
MPQSLIDLMKELFAALSAFLTALFAWIPTTFSGPSST